MVATLEEPICVLQARALRPARVDRQLLTQHESLHQQIVAGPQYAPKQTEEQDGVETHSDLRSAIIRYLRASISADRVLHPDDG